jgi:hypothetical protein
MRLSIKHATAIAALALLALPGMAYAGGTTGVLPGDHVGSTGDHQARHWGSGDEASAGHTFKKPTMFCDNAAAYTWPNSILFWNKGPGTLPAGTKVVITIQPTGQKITYILTQDWDVKTGVFLPVPIETSQPIHCSAEIFGIDRKSVPHP